MMHKGFLIENEIDYDLDPPQRVGQAISKSGMSTAKSMFGHTFAVLMARWRGASPTSTILLRRATSLR